MTVAMLECEWPGCTSDQRTTGLCDMHYARKIAGRSVHGRPRAHTAGRSVRRGSHLRQADPRTAYVWHALPAGMEGWGSTVTH